MKNEKLTKRLMTGTMFVGLMVAAAPSATGCDTDDPRYAYDPFGWDGTFNTPDIFGNTGHYDCHDMILPDRDCY